MFNVAAVSSRVAVGGAATAATKMPLDDGNSGLPDEDSNIAAPLRHLDAPEAMTPERKAHEGNTTRLPLDLGRWIAANDDDWYV